MILYHGTRLDKETILKEGLKRPDYNRLIDEVLARYGYTKDDIPEWIWKMELDYRLEEYKEFSPEFKPYLAFTLNHDQARDYAYMGGEFEYLLIQRLLAWKTGNWPKSGEEAIKGRGTMKVVTVNVPKEYIPQGELERMEKIRSVGYDPYEKFVWNIPIFRDVPPEWIMRVDEVNLDHTLVSPKIEHVS